MPEFEPLEKVSASKSQDQEQSENQMPGDNSDDEQISTEGNIDNGIDTLVEQAPLALMDHPVTGQKITAGATQGTQVTTTGVETTNITKIEKSDCEDPFDSSKVVEEGGTIPEQGCQHGENPLEKEGVGREACQSMEASSGAGTQEQKVTATGENLEKCVGHAQVDPNLLTEQEPSQGNMSESVPLEASPNMDYSKKKMPLNETLVENDSIVLDPVEKDQSEYVRAEPMGAILPEEQSSDKKPKESIDYNLLEEQRTRNENVVIEEAKDEPLVRCQPDEEHAGAKLVIEPSLEEAVQNGDVTKEAQKGVPRSRNQDDIASASTRDIVTETDVAHDNHTGSDPILASALDDSETELEMSTVEDAAQSFPSILSAGQSQNAANKSSSSSTCNESKVSSTVLIGPHIDTESSHTQSEIADVEFKAASNSRSEQEGVDDEPLHSSGSSIPGEYESHGATPLDGGIESEDLCPRLDSSFETEDEQGQKQNIGLDMNLSQGNEAVSIDLSSVKYNGVDETDQVNKTGVSVKRDNTENRTLENEPHREEAGERIDELGASTDTLVYERPEDDNNQYDNHNKNTVIEPSSASEGVAVLLDTVCSDKDGSKDESQMLKIQDRDNYHQEESIEDNTQTRKSLTCEDDNSSESHKTNSNPQHVVEPNGSEFGVQISQGEQDHHSCVQAKVETNEQSEEDDTESANSSSDDEQAGASEDDADSTDSSSEEEGSNTDEDEEEDSNTDEDEEEDSSSEDEARPPIYLYTSLTAGGYQVMTYTNRLMTILKANEIQFTVVDLATNEKAKRIWKWRSNGRKLPGVVRDEEIVGDYQEIVEANELAGVRALVYDEEDDW